VTYNQVVEFVHTIAPLGKWAVMLAIIIAAPEAP
jgi:hypothetical protein